MRSVAGIFSYSKTKGLFAGVSLEGSMIIERKDANAKLYGRQISAKELLSGAERPPPQAAPLLSILNSRTFAGMSSGSFDDRMYNDQPVYDNTHDSVVWGNNTGNAYGEGQTRNAGPGASGGQAHDEFGRPKRASTWQDDVYDQQPRGFANNRASVQYGQDSTTGGGFGGGYGAAATQTAAAEKKTGPGRPAAPKPNFASKQALMKKNEAVALYTFNADQPGDLGFQKGEIITVLKKTDSDNDWW